MSKSINSLLENNRTEEDITFGIYRDSPKTSYNPNCSMPEAGRVEIARAMDAYFLEKGIDSTLLAYYFSDTMAEDHYEDVLSNKGLRIVFNPQRLNEIGAPDNLEQMGNASREMMALANANQLKGFKTYVGDNDYHTARTWEDVGVGLNKRFDMLGSQVRINTDLCKTR